MKKLIITYSEDFRENKIAGRIYGKLRDFSFDPRFVVTNYNVKLGTAKTEYLFTGGRCPGESDLDRILLGETLLDHKLDELNLRQGTGAEVAPVTV